MEEWGKVRKCSSFTHLKLSALAWKACNNLNNIWRSNLTKNIKVKLVQATVESVLLYGSETWTVTNKIGKSLDGCCTRMLRKALDVSWKDHIANKELYGDLPKITTQISKRRLQFAGHCKRSEGKNRIRTGDMETHPGQKISRTTNKNFCRPASSRHRLHHP